MLTERLHPCTAASPARLQKLIEEPSSKRFETRKAATAELQKFDMLAELALHATLRGKPTLEQRRRVEQLLERLNDPLPPGAVLQGVRGIAVLEYIGTAEARRVLERLAGGVPEARLTREARAALTRTAKGQRVSK